MMRILIPVLLLLVGLGGGVGAGILLGGGGGSETDEMTDDTDAEAGDDAGYGDAEGGR